MTWRLFRAALWHRKGRAGLVLLAIVVGASAATALLGVSASIMGKMSQELRSYGSNIAVTPRSEGLEIDIGGVRLKDSSSSDTSYIDERELFKLKTIFWRNNIQGFVPFLSTPVRVGESRTPSVLTGTWFDKEVSVAPGTVIRTAFAEEMTVREPISLRTGVKTGFSWWQVSGNWPGDEDKEAVLVGTSLARRLSVAVGDTITVEYEGKPRTLRVVGLLATGGFEDDQVVGSLPLAQELLGLSHGVNRVMVSAAVLPAEKLVPQLRDKKPEEMTPREYEIWYCSPIVEAVAKQIEEVIPASQARPIRQIAQAEGAFLTRIEGLMTLITLFALTLSILGVMATLHTAILERRSEIGLMKALGAQDSQIAVLFLTEAAALGVLGGAVGYLLGSTLAQFIGDQVFNSAISISPALFLVALGLALAIGLLGSALPVGQAVRIDPIKLMKGH